MRQITTTLQALRTASFVLPIFAAFSSAPANAEFFLQQWQNQHRSDGLMDLSASLGYYNTQQNFDASGALQIPYELKRYSRLQSDLEVSWGLTRRFSVFGKAAWSYIELDHASRTSSAFGFSDQTAGANFRIYERGGGTVLAPSGLDLQMQIDFPAYDNAAATINGVPFLGDGSVDVTAGAFLTVPLAQSSARSVIVSGGGGYTRRSSGFSAGLPWSVTASYLPAGAGRTFGSLAMTGFYSLRTDTTLTDGTSRSSIATGGSFISNAINPSIAQVKGTFGYQLTSQLHGFVNGSYSFVGQNAPSGFLASLGIRVVLGAVSRTGMPEQDYPHANRGLLVYSLDAPVLRVNDRLNVLKIGKGRQDGVEVGQIFDIFEQNKELQTLGDAVARAHVTGVRFDEADVAIDEVFKEVWIKEGFVAKRLIR